MRVLIIKMTSMGDVLHTLPAVTDACNNISGIRFDWVVEEAFREIPGWHSGVDRSIPLSLRKWRREPARWLGREVREALHDLRRERYDYIIDAQGLLKSAAIACLARGKRAGYSPDSARESPAARVYSHRTSTPGKLHAIDRSRMLFAGTLGYELPRSPPEYGVSRADFRMEHDLTKPYLVFNHASTWDSKSWPHVYWHELIGRAAETGFNVMLPWGSEAEYEQAMRLTRDCELAEPLPRMKLDQLAAVLAHARAVVSVDTGLGHLAAALGTPAVSIYGATDPALTGTVGEGQHHVEAAFPCSPCLNRHCTYSAPTEVTPACYSTVSPDRVWGTLQRCIDKGDR